MNLGTPWWAVGTDLRTVTACDVTWTERNPALPHESHACVFRIPAARHSRHECICGLNLHTRELA